jgi:hypothetical protein
MPITIFLAQLALLEFLLLFVFRWKFMAAALIWTVLIGLLVMVVEIVLTFSGFTGKPPKP